MAPKKLLLADDSVTIQRVMELTFADEDIRVICVSDGDQAIERIDVERPDIVLADVAMPGRDGYQVTEHVKQTSHLAHVPVLLLTGAFEPVDEERARVAGCDGVLMKPFEPRTVIKRVLGLLARPVTPAVPAAQAAGPSDAAPAPTAVPPAPALAAPAPLSSGDASVMPMPESESVAGIDRPWTPAELALGETVPAEPTRPTSNESLDDYFDRLDAAFAGLESPPDSGGDPLTFPSPVPRAEPAEFARPGGEVQRAAPPAEELPAAAPPVPESEPAARMPETRAAVDVAAAPPAEPGGVPPGPSSPVTAPRPAAAPIMPEPTVPPVLSPTPVAPPAASAVTVDDELVQRVSQIVLEQMSDRVVREVVSEVVLKVADRLVREEIDRIESGGQ